MSVQYDSKYKSFKCSECTDLLKFSRGCGLKEYKGDIIEPKPIFKINFGKTIINECPISHCSWENVNEAMCCYQYFEQGYLPEVWDTQYNRPCSILDQTEFFHKSYNLVTKVKNEAERQALEESKRKKAK